MTEENWKPVLGFEGLYEVSDHGRVRSLLRSRSEILVGGVSQNGYRNVLLSKNGKVTGRSVHSLVLEAFVAPRVAGMQACHWDGVKSNNRLDNLRWDTAKANKHDQRRHGTIGGAHKGTAHHLAKLWPEAIWVIRAEPEFRGVVAMLSRAFGVSTASIRNVRSRKIWQHI